MDLTIDTVDRESAAQSIEIVERKGLGHPDTLCDAIAGDWRIRSVSDAHPGISPEQCDRDRRRRSAEARWFS